MKIKNLFLLIAFGLMSFGFVACNDDDELDDFYPVEFEVKIVDADGNNLLNSETNDDFDKWLDETTFSVKHGTSQYGVTDARYSTQYTGKDFYGVRMVGDGESTVLKIGRWDGNKNIESAVVLCWSNGNDELSFKNVITYNENGVAVVNRTFFLNGQMIDSPKVTFVK